VMAVYSSSFLTTDLAWVPTVIVPGTRGGRGQSAAPGVASPNSVALGRQCWRISFPWKAAGS
jgi:hypothetical protein